MRTITTVVIGAGHAGLAMSRCLTERSIDHVVLERGEVANSWRTERWDSLRLLTPNWQSRLPGYGYEGDDPDGFRTMPEVIDFIDALCAGDRRAGARRTRRSPRCARTDDGYSGRDRSGRLALPDASCSPAAPATSPASRRSPQALPPAIAHAHAACSTAIPASSRTGGVLGRRRLGDRHRSSPTRSSARAAPVTLAVGEHIRVPRHLSRPGHPVVDGRRRRARRALRRGRRHRPRAAACRRCSSSATPERATLDLNALTAHRREARRPPRRHHATARRSSRARCATSARWPISRWAGCSILIDDWAARNGLDGRVEPPQRFAPTRRRASAAARRSISPRGAIATIIWATGFRPDYSWLDVPVLDRKGRIRHDGGVVDVARHVRDGPAVPAPPQVDPDRRRRRRRPRPQRAISRPISTAAWRGSPRERSARRRFAIPASLIGRCRRRTCCSSESPSARGGRHRRGCRASRRAP